MSHEPLLQLKELAGGLNAKLEEKEGAFVFFFSRNSLDFYVTVAYEALEWSLVLHDPITEHEYNGWSNYRGYDSRPDEELAEEMASDLRELLASLGKDIFRIVEKKSLFSKKTLCERMKDGKWEEFDC